MSESDLSVSELVHRVRDELGALFDRSAPITIGLAPQCVDVIGGLLAGHGGTRCLMPVDRHACALVQPRADRQAMVFDFNEYIQHRPFTLQMSVDALRSVGVSELKKNLAEPGRSFAEQAIAAARAHLEQAAPSRGFNLVLYRPADLLPGAASYLAALAALRLADESKCDLESAVAQLIRLWQLPESVAVEARAGLTSIVSQMESDDPASLALVVLPDEVEVVAIPIGGRVEPAFRARHSAAARMAHHLVLEKMRAFGREAGRELISDPMNGRIGNLAMSDYKKFFRGALPESIRGSTFRERCGDAIPLDADADYGPQFVADHLVIESHRAREWVRHLRHASEETDRVARKLAIDKAGHLMYASHKSARESCGLGSDEADRRVDAVRACEPAGFYGARLSADGALMIVLCQRDARWAELQAAPSPQDADSSRAFRRGRGAAACRTLLDGAVGGLTYV